MAATFCPLSLTALMDEDGVPIVGAYIRFFDAGTTTPRAVYKDGFLGSAYDPNAIRTNASGRIPSVWIDGNPYRVQITKPGGALIEDIDNLPINSGGGGGTPAPDTAIETGDVVWSYRTGPRLGWVRPNGRTLGSAMSGATERANDDCEALFGHLWEADPALAVSGGRGANAASDWAAGKTIALPDLRGRTPVALDGLGASASGRLADVVFAAGNATTLGSTGGAATHVLDKDQLPAVAISGMAEAAGSHTHTGTTGAAGAFTPAGTVTVSYPAHQYWRSTFGSISSAYPGVPVNVATSESQVLTTPPAMQDLLLSGTAVAAHTHTFTTASGGSHTHAVTTDPLGLGAAIQHMPPFVLMTAYMRL